MRGKKLNAESPIVEAAARVMALTPKGLPITKITTIKPPATKKAPLDCV
jgi:hypothetical protein